MKEREGPTNTQVHPCKRERRSIRLEGYNYAQEGSYFVTICVKNRRCVFGNVVDGEMVLNDAGHMVEKWYWEQDGIHGPLLPVSRGLARRIVILRANDLCYKEQRR